MAEGGSADERLVWSGDGEFELDGTHFVVDVFATAGSTVDRFALAKPRWLVEEYLALVPDAAGGAVVELGIAKGGSVALFTHLFAPGHFLAVELESTPNRALAEFLAADGRDRAVRAEYGVDQGDRERLARLVDEHFGDRALDLVVDDAAHLLGPATASFDLLFPRLRPGGVYVLEDWSHGHTWERVARAMPDQFDASAVEQYVASPRAGWDLSQLVLELVLTNGFAPETVAEMRARNGFVSVRRGDAPLGPDFRIGAAYGDVGRALLTGGSGGATA